MLCDPVLSCLAVTPVLLLKHLPVVLDQLLCIRSSTSLNDTHNCTDNGTQIQLFDKRATKQQLSFSTAQVLRIKVISFQLNVLSTSVVFHIKLRLLCKQ